jgi:hypothetical protein
MRPEGVNGSQSDFASKHWKWTLHFNWDETNAQTTNTSANKWSHDYKTFLILTWDQQNKRTANRIPKSLKRSNTVSSTSVVFSSTKFYSWIQILNQTNFDWDKILHTPEQIRFQNLPKFWAHSRMSAQNKLQQRDGELTSHLLYL